MEKSMNGEIIENCMRSSESKNDLRSFVEKLKDFNTRISAAKTAEEIEAIEEERRKYIVEYRLAHTGGNNEKTQN